MLEDGTKCRENRTKSRPARTAPDPWPYLVSSQPPPIQDIRTQGQGGGEPLPTRCPIHEWDPAPISRSNVFAVTPMPMPSTIIT